MPPVSGADLRAAWWQFSSKFSSFSLVEAMAGELDGYGGRAGCPGLCRHGVRTPPWALAVTVDGGWSGRAGAGFPLVFLLCCVGCWLLFGVLSCCSPGKSRKNLVLSQGVKSGYIRGDKDMMIVEGKVVYMESALG